MGKKLKALAGSLAEGQLATTVKESAQQIWLAGLGAFAKAQEEGNKVFDALVKEGESIQSKTRKLTDAKIAAVTGGVAGTWDRLEQVFEDRVARALGSLGVPSKKDIDKLSKRVAELTAVVQTLTEAKAEEKSLAEVTEKLVAEPIAKSSAKPVTKKAAVKPVPDKATAVPAAKKSAVKKVVAKPETALSEAVAVAPLTPAEVLKNIADSNA